MKKITVALIGAGQRGSRYTNIMGDLPEKFQVVAVAEPIERRRKYIQQKHNVPDEMCFNSWDELLALPKLADMAIIATMDEMHYEPAMKAISLGYDLLLEKPVAQTAKECADIALAAKEKGVKVLVCHVLRYSPFFKSVKDLLMQGAIGEVMSGIQVEAVGNRHQSHSYVRGNWHSEKDTTPMLLAKCCHDIDILQWLLDKPCKKVQSFGELSHFCAENAPEGAPIRCADGGCPVADTCPYNCIKLYYDDKNNGWFRDACTKSVQKDGGAITDEDVMTALKTTDYGLCVYHANNDVVDHQTVNMQFEGGTTVTLHMNAFNEGGRYIRLFGTKGELYANMKDPEITLYTFADRKTTQVPVKTVGEAITYGHGGGDNGIVEELYDYFTDDYKGVCAADINISVKNHLIGFAAEVARHTDSVESIDDFFKNYGFDND